MRALVLTGLAVAAVSAAPGQARMSQTALFGWDLLPHDVGGMAMRPAGDPGGAMFERMFREFSTAPERLPRARPRNDIDATLEAMEQARIGFGEGKELGGTPRRRGRKPSPKS